MLAAAVKAKGLGNPITDEQLVAGVVGQLTVDSGFSASDMISLVLGFHNVNVNAAPQLTLPVVVDQFGSYIYQGGNYGDIEFPAQPQDHTTVDQFLGLTSGNDDTYSGGKLPAPSTVTVAVLNGSGAYNQATDTAESLRALGFKVGTIGDSPVRRPGGRDGRLLLVEDTGRVGGGPGRRQLHVGRRDHVRGPHPGEAWLAGHRRHGNPVQRERAADHLDPDLCRRGGGHPRLADHDDHDVSVFVVGQRRLRPPTATVEPLQPWDPRSCTPSGGEGT